MTAEQVLADAVGTLAGWIGGWTMPPDGEPQRRVRVMTSGDDHVDVLVEAARFSDEQDRRFRITLTAEELS